MAHDPTPKARLLTFQQAQRIRKKYEVKGMLLMGVKEPYTIDMVLCPEIWEIPTGFVREMRALTGDIRIKGTPLEHLPYIEAWLQSHVGIHLQDLWKKSNPWSPQREFIGKILRVLHCSEVGNFIETEGLPECPVEAYHFWNSNDHPIGNYIRTVA
jgi:hypothetical protein